MEVVQMRRSVTLALTAGAFLALAATLASGGSPYRARAAEGCGLQSLRGGYGFAFEGQVAPSAAAEFDLAGAGRILFDGHAGLSGREAASTNGAQETLTFTGTYTVQPDCSGTATIANSNGRTDHITFGLVEGGQEFNFRDTDPGVVLTGQASRQAVNHCNDRSLRGVFNVAASGSFFDAGAEVTDWSISGDIHFDGQGHEFGSVSGNFGGPFADTFTGTYQVNPDCTGSTIGNFSTGSSDHLFIVLVEQGNEVKFISTDPGNVIAGNFDRMSNGDDSSQN